MSPLSLKFGLCTLYQIHRKSWHGSDPPSPLSGNAWHCNPSLRMLVLLDQLAVLIIITRLMNAAAMSWNLFNSKHFKNIQSFVNCSLRNKWKVMGKDVNMPIAPKQQFNSVVRVLCDIHGLLRMQRTIER